MKRAAVFILCSLFVTCLHAQQVTPFIIPNATTFYTSSGTVSGTIKCMATNTTSTATTGAFSFNLAPLGITTLLTVQVQSLSLGTGAGQLNNAYIYPAPTATSVVGIVGTGVPALGALAATIVPQASVTTVYGLFCGI